MSTTSKKQEIKEYKNISPYGYIKEDKVYLKGYFDFPDREIGVVRENDEESMQYFVNRFEMVTQKVQTVKDSVATAENKGSYLMKLIHMKTYLAEYNGLGDFPQLFNVIDELEENIKEYIEKNREKNYEIKSALLADAINVIHSEDWGGGAMRMKELKMNWIKTGSAHDGEEEKLTEKFNETITLFFDKRKEFYKEQSRVMRQRTYTYESMLQQIKRINYDGAGPEVASLVKQMQNDWKNVGKISQRKYMSLNNEFRREASRYFENLKRMNTKKKSSIDQKKDYLQEVESILQRGVPFNIKQIRDYQLEWKKIGKLPQIEDKDLNLKFRIACNEIFETHFLEKTVQQEEPNFRRMSPNEQVRARIAVLRGSMKLDENDLEEFNRKNQYVFDTGRADYSLQQQRNNFINKLKTKQRILRKLESQLF